MPPRPIHLDTVIIGGGVAALWTGNVLRDAGQSIAILANAPLGSGQTLAAQGVIHGGLKYAAGGKLSDSSEALAEMPARWLAAMRGEGPVDLSDAELLCDHQVLWSLPNVVSRVMGFFGSKAVRGRSSSIAREDTPTVFDTPDYHGSLFRIEEPVVDPVSLVRELARGVADESWLVDWESSARIEVSPEGIGAILLGEEADTVRLTADRYLLAAGAGNGPLLGQLGIESPRMQLRPLHQIVVRDDDLPAFFSVCVGTGPKPPVVTTTHTDSSERRLWYIGGDIAEADGVARDEEAQVAAGKEFFAKQLPWIDLSGADWFTVRVDRAEPLTGTGDRPPGAFLERVGNVLVAWPTKLALAPGLADRVLEETHAAGGPAATELPLPRPGIGTAPWDRP